MIRHLVETLAVFGKRAIRIVPFLLIASSCDNTKFEEHPPRNYLTDQEEDALVRRFVKDLYNDLRLEGDRDVMKRIWRLRYYVDNGRGKYFLITNKGGAFSSGLMAYAGEMLVNESDTTFNTTFEIEPHHLNWEDSVKRSFEGLLLSK